MWFSASSARSSSRRFRLWAVALLAAGFLVPIAQGQRAADAAALGPFASAESLVSQQYRDFYEREPDGGGSLYWTGRITSGRASPSQVIEAFMRSPEFSGSRAPVLRLYRALFSRVPDAGGFKYWTLRLRSGATPATIANHFASSPEFESRYGRLGNSEFVSRLYLEILGRRAETTGQRYWVTQLQEGRSRGDLVSQLTESGEYRRRSQAEIDVSMVYLGMLRRVPDTAGFARWLTTVRSGQSIRVMIDDFLGSAEYAARFRTAPTTTTTTTPTVGSVNWVSANVEWTVPQGSTVLEDIDFDSTVSSVTNPRVVVAGPVASLVSAGPGDVTTVGASGRLTVRIAAPGDATGSYDGTVTMLDGEVPLSSALPIRVIVEGPTSEIPIGPVSPSPDRIGATPSGQPIVKDELAIGIGFAVSTPDATARQVASATGGSIIGSVPGARLYQLRFPGATREELEALAAVARGVSGVEVVSLNTIDPEPDAATPDDSGWDSWNVASPGGNNWGMEWIDAPGAWDITTGSSGVRVAVIDSDMDEDHGDLDDNVSRKSRGRPAGGHGTHVAGTICAEGNNGKGVSGVMWDCDLRYFAYGTDAVSTAAAMVSAVDDGADVVNMSLQFISNNTPVPITPELIALAEDTNDIFARPLIHALVEGDDVLWVFAAGNESGRDVQYTAPGGLASRFPANTISVAAIGRDGNLASFSNVGSGISVAAPGVDIRSTLPRTGCWIFTLGCDDAYGGKSGTSMAAPHVAGLAGLVMSKYPARTAAQVKQCIVSGAEIGGTAVPGHAFSVVNAPASINCTSPGPTRIDIRFDDDNGPTGFGHVDFSTVAGGLIRLDIQLKNATPNSAHEAYFVCGPIHALACGYITLGTMTTDAAGSASAVFEIVPPYPSLPDDHVDILGGGLGYTAGPVSSGGSAGVDVPGEPIGAEAGDPTQ